MNKLQKRIISALKGKKYPVNPRDLMKKAGERSMLALYEELTRLEKDGEISIDKKGRISLSSATGLVGAEILSLSNNFAFAKPNEGEDIYISRENLAGALAGDTVLLKVWNNKGRGLEGSVQKITNQGKRMIIGKAEIENGKLVFEGKGQYRFKIPIKKSQNTDVKAGDKVKVKIENIYNRASRREEIIAQVVTVFGSSQSARVSADAIIDAAGIPTEFSEKALKEAEKLSIEAEDYENRLDLRGEKIFTIDGADAKDLDDAISVKKTKKGWELGVHIADVSHYVKGFSALDKEAMERGTSVYFSDRVIPMYPEALSNGVCSLNCGTDKLTFSALITLDKAGNMVSFTFKKTVINSVIRGVYSEINEILDGTASKEIKEKYAVIEKEISLANELHLLIKENAQKRGILQLESVETRFILDEDGVCVDIAPRTRGAAEEIIEQFMITANVAAAKFARKMEIPFLYRIHQQPNGEKIEELAEFISLLGLNAGALRGEVDNFSFGDILKQADEKGCELIVSDKVLRTMAKARYDENPFGHFGLSLEDYSHFTSPIRRYPDTAIHRILSDAIENSDVQFLKKRYEKFVQIAAKTSSDCEVRAMSAERDADDCYMAEYLSAHIGEQYNAVVRSIMPYGFYVSLENSAQGLVRIESLAGIFDFDGKMTLTDRLSGKKIKVGDSMRVVVKSADISSGLTEFDMA